MAKDIFECDVQISNLQNQVIPIERLEKLCMKAKGYNIHSGEAPEEVKDILESPKEK